ncbi:MAG: 50S ribosomal protein L18 [Thermoleophilia bacterium]|nr:50S ribosomal protein L18 [Thermoleophilia bacterium]
MAKTTTELLARQKVRARRHRRVRLKVTGMPDRPRMTVFRSNKGIYAQVIDDLEGRTLVSASSAEVKESGLKKAQTAEKVGELLAAKAKEKNIDKVVFDRGSYLYHGRVKSLAEGARKGGIEF